MDPARESDPRSSAHSELEAILRDADAARRRADDDASADKTREPRPRLNLVDDRNGGARTRGAPIRSTIPRQDVRFDTFDVRVDAPGEMKIKAYRFSGRLVIALVLGVAVAFQWISLPNGVPVLRPQPLPDSYTEASARWAMVLMAERIDHFRLEHQRLPDGLAELEPAPSDMITYQRLSENEYQLQAPGTYRALTVGPTTRRELFLSNSVDLLRLGPDKAP